MHVTSPVIMIQQFMLYDLSWTFCFTKYDSRLFQDFMISCLLTCTVITYKHVMTVQVSTLSRSFSMHVFWFRLIDLHVITLFWISGFMIITILYLLTSCPSTCILFHLSPAFVLLYHVFPCSISLSLYLLSPACLGSRHGFQCMSMILIFWYTCAYLCTPLGIRITTRRGVLTPLDPYVQVSELGTCEFSQLLIRVAQLMRGSPTDRLKPHPSRFPCTSLEFSFCKLMNAPCTVHTCTSLCILAIALIGDVIFL